MGDYEVFKEKVFQLTKIDLNCYKERQMRRRIDSLITKAQIKSYDELEELLNKYLNESSDPEEKEEKANKKKDKDKKKKNKYKSDI